MYSGKPGKVEGLSIRGRYGSGIGLLQEKYHSVQLWDSTGTGHACGQLHALNQVYQAQVRSHSSLPMVEGIGWERAGPSLDIGTAVVSFPHCIF